MLARDWLILSTKEKPRILIGAWVGTNIILIGAWHKQTNIHIYRHQKYIYLLRIKIRAKKTNVVFLGRCRDFNFALEVA